MDTAVATFDFQQAYSDIHKKIEVGVLTYQQASVRFKLLLPKVTATDPSTRFDRVKLLNSLGICYSVTGDLKASNDNYQQASKLLAELERPVVALQMDLNVALNLTKMLPPRSMIAEFDKLHQRARALPHNEALFLVLYAQLYKIVALIRLGGYDAVALINELSAARDTIDAQPHLFGGGNLERLRNVARLTLAEVYLRAARYDEAWTEAHNAYDLTGGDNYLVGIVQQMYGDLTAYHPHPTHGTIPHALYEQARATFAKGNAYEEIGNTYFAEGYTSAMHGNIERAEHYFKQALTYYAGRQMSYKVGQANDAIKALRAGESLGAKPIFVGE